MKPFAELDVDGTLELVRDALCAAAAAHGLSAFVSFDTGSLEALNARHRESWFELLPRPASAPALCVGVADRHGEPVAVQASVLLDCCGRAGFAGALETMAAFYDGEPPADAWCFTASPEAREARGLVAFMSSGWVRPDNRAGDLFHLAGRLNRFAALALWNPAWMVALVDPPASRLWTEKAVGERHMDRHPTVLLHQPGVGRLRLHVLRLRAGAVREDLARRASGPPTAPPAMGRTASR